MAPPIFLIHLSSTLISARSAFVASSSSGSTSTGPEAMAYANLWSAPAALSLFAKASVSSFRLFMNPACAVRRRCASLENPGQLAAWNILANGRRGVRTTDREPLGLQVTDMVSRGNVPFRIGCHPGREMKKGRPFALLASVWRPVASTIWLEPTMVSRKNFSASSIFRASI